MFELIFKLPRKLGYALIVFLLTVIFAGNLLTGHPSYPGLYFIPILLGSFLLPRIMAFAVIPISIILCVIIDFKQVTDRSYLNNRIILFSLLFLLIFFVGTELKKYIDLLNTQKENISKINRDIVFAFVCAIDAMDPYLTNHSRNVSMYARQIADCLRLPKEEVDNIYWSAVLHDIGKIGVSENILHKSDPLEFDEWAKVKKHPEIGAEILKKIPSFEKLVPNVLYHHQRYDGSGYPGCLKGKEIPLGARILAIADAYDAMTSDRSYRKSLSEDMAREELIKCAGTQFDPDLVRIFITCLQNPVRALINHAGNPFGEVI